MLLFTVAARGSTGKHMLVGRWQDFLHNQINQNIQFSINLSNNISVYQNVIIKQYSDI